MECLKEVLEGWRGTPYASGQSCRGVAASCSGFAFGALAELIGSAGDWSPPSDDEFRGRAARRAILEVIRRFAPVVSLRSPEAIEPGDVVIAAQPFGRLRAHVYLGGPEPGTLWEAGCGGVHPTGIGELSRNGRRVQRLYRMLRRERWLNRSS